MSKGPPHWWRIVAITAAAGFLSAACGASTTSSPACGASPSPSHSSAAPSSPAASPASASALCQDAAALRTSLNTLTHVKIGKGTADEIKSDLADVEAKLTTFTTSAKGQFHAQTSALKSALGKLKTAVSDLTAHPSTSTVSGVVTALGGVSAAAGSLLTSLGPQCGSASASPSA